MRNFNHTEQQGFKSEVVDNYLLDEAVAWIASNLQPEDVFSVEVLEDWALDAGYVEEE